MDIESSLYDDPDEGIGHSLPTSLSRMDNFQSKSRHAIHVPRDSCDPELSFFDDYGQRLPALQIMNHDIV